MSLYDFESMHNKKWQKTATIIHFKAGLRTHAQNLISEIYSLGENTFRGYSPGIAPSQSWFEIHWKSMQQREWHRKSARFTQRNRKQWPAGIFYPDFIDEIHSWFGENAWNIVSLGVETSSDAECRTNNNQFHWIQSHFKDYSRGKVSSISEIISAIFKISNVKKLSKVRKITEIGENNFFIRYRDILNSKEFDDLKSKISETVNTDLDLTGMLPHWNLRKIFAWQLRVPS